MKIKYENYLELREKKRKPEKIQACTGLQPLTCAISVQLSSSRANKQTGSTSLNWLVINP